MNELDQKLRKHYKSEIDENLFDGLQFDSRLKERIRNGIHPETKRSDHQRWFSRLRMKWIYGSMTAAAAIFGLFIVLNMLQSSPSPISPPIQTGTILITPEGDPTTEPLKIRELQNAEEAQQAYGRDLNLPAYTPDSYNNDKIVAYGTTDGPISKVVFHYTADDIHYYELSVENNSPIEAFANDEKIVINGVTGYIHSDEKIGTTLFWMVDDNLYSIYGTLTRKETLKVAESINHEQKQNLGRN